MVRVRSGVVMRDGDYLEMQILADESRRRRVFTLNPREVIIFQKRIFAHV